MRGSEERTTEPARHEMKPERQARNEMRNERNERLLLQQLGCGKVL